MSDSPDVPEPSTSMAMPARAANVSIADIIRQRRTTKVLASEHARQSYARCWTAEHRQALRRMIETAGYAPFHRRADERTHRQSEQCSPVPWRFHILEGAALERLIDYLRAQAAASTDAIWAAAWKSKIKNMLAACGALVEVTWLPDPTPDGEAPGLTINNAEHIAAAGAAVQNLLLLAEAEGWRSYWSSGGILREPALFDYLGIARAQVLLGAVFLSPQEMPTARELAGGLRDERGSVDDWARWVSTEAMPSLDSKADRL